MMAMTAKQVVRTGIIWLATCLALLPLTAVGRAIHYGAVSDPELARCDALQWRGETASARACYQQLLSGATPAPTRAEAAWALGDLKNANGWFQAAMADAPDDAAIRLRWGELFAQTYQYSDALKLFEEAQQRDPDNAFVSVAAARVLAERFEGEATTRVEALLDEDKAPAGARLGAWLLAARMALESSNPERADEALQQAEAVATAAGLPRLEVYALRAAMDLLNGKSESDWIAAALAANPRFGEVYATPAHFYWITRRYREAVTLYEQAVKTQPDLWSAHLELGINLLRDNNVSRARVHLETAYEGDPYNPRTVNTLRLLDSFDRFELINYPERPPANGRPRLTLRLHKDERGVLAPYVRQLAEQSMARFAERYRFEPKEPVIIEVYPDHEDFVVRTTGMPGLGILGATFGYLLAMDSPTAHPEASYHWGTTLWHEMAHVFTLEATNHLVPRWFSEGVSVFEEWRTGPTPGVRIPLNIYQAMAEGRFLPIAELDGGFIRPSYPGQVQVSYMQAGLICEFIDSEFGFEKVVDLLYEFGEGAATVAAMESALGIDASEFDRDFKRYLEERFGELLDNLGAWRQANKAALDAVAHEDWPAAIVAANQAIDMFPGYVEAETPYLTLAQAHEARGEGAAVIQALTDYWRQGGYRPDVLKDLASNLHQNGQLSQAVQVLQDVNFVAPFDADLHGLLGDWLVELDRPADALVEYQVTLAMEPLDLAAAHFRLARAHHLLEQASETRQHLLAALEIAPHFRPAQQLLLEIARARQ
jgi:tetratricopeptide (TPR) repeat protein